MRTLLFFLLIQLPCLGAAVGLIEAKRLMRNLESYQIIDVRPKAQFTKGHIPHSTHMMWEDWSQQKFNFWNRLFGDPGKWGKVILDKTQVQQRLRHLGLSSQKPFVVVGAPRAFGEEGRVAWNLLVWGAHTVLLLNGGFPAWEKESFPIVAGQTSPKTPGTFEVALQLHRIAPLARVRALLKNSKARVYDARTKAEFQGKTLLGQKRGGHIPGAKLIEYKTLYKADGRFIDQASFRRLTQNGPGLSYCTGGVRSALFVLLYEIYWKRMLPNYDGSMWEWAADSTLPVNS